MRICLVGTFGEHGRPGAQGTWGDHGQGTADSQGPAGTIGAPGRDGSQGENGGAGPIGQPWCTNSFINRGQSFWKILITWVKKQMQKMLCIGTNLLVAHMVRMCRLFYAYLRWLL